MKLNILLHLILNQFSSKAFVYKLVKIVETKSNILNPLFPFLVPPCSMDVLLERRGNTEEFH